MNPVKKIELPVFKTTITDYGPGFSAYIDSDIGDDTVEAFILALYKAGFDMTSPRMLEAIETVVDAVDNNS